MTVRGILATKGRDVVTIFPNRTLADAALVLSERGLGALVVVGASDEVIGILSERDIVRSVAARGPGALGETVGQNMTADVVTTVESATVQTVMAQMTDGRFRHVPVLDGGKLAGIVSIGDVVKYRLAEMESEQQALREYIATA